MPDATDVQRLLVQAANAETLQESQRLVGEAEALRTALYREAADNNSVDLANAIVQDHLRPVAVHEHHTAATDWLADLATTSDLTTASYDAQAQGTVWFNKLATEVRSDEFEFTEQARGMARRIAGAHGENAPAVQDAFLAHVASLRTRADMNPAVFSTQQQNAGLPQAQTTSERATNIQILENPNPGQDVTPANDPGLGQVDNQVSRFDTSEFNSSPTNNVADLGQDKQAAKTAKKESGMPHAQCPTCGGHGRVAVRETPLPSIEQIIRQGVSGLDQIDQTVDPHDNGPKPTPYPADVAFPLVPEWVNGQQGSDIPEAESQIQQRQQMSPTANRQPSKQDVARYAAAEAYRQVMAGYDASGWAGDMGQTPPSPGQQDGGNQGQPYSNLGFPDPVYGQGGDNGNQPLKPYGQDEANDYTNNPGMNYTPGQPTQYDIGSATQTTNAPPGGGAPGFPNPPKNNGTKQSSRVEDDPELRKALDFARRRRAFLESQKAS